MKALRLRNSLQNLIFALTISKVSKVAVITSLLFPSFFLHIAILKFYHFLWKRVL